MEFTVYVFVSSITNLVWTNQSLNRANNNPIYDQKFVIKYTYDYEIHNQLKTFLSLNFISYYFFYLPMMILCKKVQLYPQNERTTLFLATIQ
jgi:hypothetical protein